VPPPRQDWTQPLVWLVAAMFVAGVAAGVFVAHARSPAYALGSELVYRLEIEATAAELDALSERVAALEDRLAA
jgi:ubiquinone biosynthesis protein UbiJ